MDKKGVPGEGLPAGAGKRKDKPLSAWTLKEAKEECAGRMRAGKDCIGCQLIGICPSTPDNWWLDGPGEERSVHG